MEPETAGAFCRTKMLVRSEEEAVRTPGEGSENEQAQRHSDRCCMMKSLLTHRFGLFPVGKRCASGKGLKTWEITTGV